MSLRINTQIILIVNVLAQPVLIIIQNLFNGLGLLNEDVTALIRGVITALLSVLSFVICIRVKTHNTIITYLIGIFLLFLSAFMCHKNIEFLLNDGIKLFLVTNLTVFISVICINNWKLFFKTGQYVSIVILAIGCVYIYKMLTNQLINLSLYSMSMGYALLLPALMFTINSSKANYFMFFLTIIIILVIGNRAPVFIGLSFFIIVNLIRVKNKLIIICTSILFICITLFIILPYLLEVLDLYGIQSRTLLLLEEGGFTRDSGRTSIYIIGLNKIYESPIFGYGIFGDRQFYNGFYVHNIFMEIILHFGVIIGGIIIIVLGIVTFIKYINLAEKEIILFFIFLGFVPLLVSSSYLINTNFFLLLGFLFNKNIK